MPDMVVRNPDRLQCFGNLCINNLTGNVDARTWQAVVAIAACVTPCIWRRTAQSTHFIVNGDISYLLQQIEMFATWGAFLPPFIQDRQPTLELLQGHEWFPESFNRFGQNAVMVIYDIASVEPIVEDM
ncbi:MAG: hypothetical protein AAFU54_08720 [Chloroflexota bacterium]